jgi:hypothetical protein
VRSASIASGRISGSIARSPCAFTTSTALDGQPVCALAIPGLPRRPRQPRTYRRRDDAGARIGRRRQLVHERVPGGMIATSGSLVG